MCVRVGINHKIINFFILMSTVLVSNPKSLEEEKTVF